MVRTLIVVPCFNEETRLDTQAFRDHLKSRDDTAFVMVNDGSRDGTLAVLKALEAEFPQRITALDQQPNQGKAEAVRVGMLHAISRGAENVGYWDADLATPLAAIGQFIEVLERRSDVEFVLGSRVQLLGRRIVRKPLRHYLGRVFATVASLTLSLRVYDTQCGAKLIRVKSGIAKCLERPFGSRWIFDVELLARFLSTGHAETAIYEVPLDDWEDIGASKVRGVDFFRAIGELVAIYRGYRLPRRYQRLFDLATAPFLRYAGAGSIGTLAHYLVLLLTVEALHWKPAIGTAIGATIGALINYLLNYHVTFASQVAHGKTLPRFLAVAALGIGLNAAGMSVLPQRLGGHLLLAQLACTAATLGLGFLLNRAWTFARAEPL